MADMHFAAIDALAVEYDKVRIGFGDIRDILGSKSKYLTDFLTAMYKLVGFIPPH